MSDRPIAFLGLDPGTEGACAVLDAAGIVLECHDTPTVQVATSGRTKGGKPKMRSEYDTAAMAALIADLAQRYQIRRATTERILAMPSKRPRFAAHAAPGVAGRPLGAVNGSEGPEGRGSLAAVSLAESSGLWRGICAAHRIPVERVMPATWKARLIGSSPPPAGVSRSQRSALVKERARARALELFPAFAGQIGRKKDHGRAESALLAEYGRRLG